jgi:hypothetical protein
LLHKLIQEPNDALLKIVRGELSFIVQVNPYRLRKVKKLMDELEKKHGIKLYKRRYLLAPGISMKTILNEVTIPSTPSRRRITEEIPF